MSWEDQGRQYHVWFGNGTAGNKATKTAPSSSVVGQSTADRVLALAYGALASLITAGGRLLLAMLERCVTDAGGSYLFCDTDSLCIVSNKPGGLVPCLGGDHKLKDGRDAVKVLSWQDVDEIAAKFNALNPYAPSLVQHILKIEDVLKN